MITILLASSVLLWLAVLCLGFLLIGSLRALTLLRWQFEQLQATTPVRKGRGGLKPGKQAPLFSLSTVGGGEISLADYAGRKVFLVFVQTGCQPCHDVAPELNRLQASGKCQVLVVNNGERSAVEKWADEVHADFPVLIQDKWSVSKRYEVLATPFAFLINEQGKITSTGFASNKQYMSFVLEGRSAAATSESGEGESTEPEEPSSRSSSKELEHV
ncbi:MAG TPA: TlpA family protein disulfide reductase [Gemmataceae bacterium]|nr:TlpA family protein disulfide reductase [Gemmataceae bacterium]